MFSFFQTIFHKVTTVVATAAIAIGLISSPVPPTPILVNPNNTSVIDQQEVKATKTAQQAQTEKAVKNPFLEVVKPKTTSDSIALEKAKQEAEVQRIAREQAEAKLKEIQDQQSAQATAQPQSLPPDITNQVGSYISNKYSEFKELVNAYDNCISKYQQIIKPLQDEKRPIDAEINNMTSELEQNYKLLMNQDFSKKLNDLTSRSLSMSQKIAIQMEAQNQECTPYANLALGKAPYEGVNSSSGFSQIIQQLNTPQQSYNYFQCTTGYAPGRGWTTNCSDNTTCYTSCGAGSCRTTCY